MPLEEELVEDRYASLQAQAERRRNEAWMSTGASGYPRQTSEELPEGDDLSGELPASEGDSAASPAQMDVRVEGQHEFAPYSQLFCAVPAIEVTRITARRPGLAST